jgi:WD40 repeat protein
MSDQALPLIWATSVSDGGLGSLVSSGDKVVLGTSKNAITDVFGSLVVLDANTGVILREARNHWRVHALALSSEGRWLATSEHPDRDSGLAQPGDVDRIRILDVDTGDERCRHTGPLPSGTQALTFSPDGRSVAAVGDQNPLVFDAVDGRQLWRTHLDGATHGIAWSPDSESVAVGFRLGVTVLEGRSGSPRFLASSPSPAVAVAYGPDGSRIVAGCADGTIRAFAADSGLPVWSQQVSGSTVVSLAVSDDRRWVAGVSRDKILAVCDLRTGTPRYPPARCDFLSEGNRVLFSPTLRHILAMDWDSRTFVVDARTGRPTRSCPGRACLIPPDGTAIAAGHSFVVERYDLGVRVFERSIGANLTALDMSPAGMSLVAVADVSAAVTILDATSGARLANRRIPGTIAAVAFAERGASAAAGGSDGLRLFSILGDRSWKADTIGPVNALAVTGPAGEWIAVAAGKTVRLLASADGHARWPEPHTHPQTVTRIAASSDGRWIATGCADRHTRILDARTGTETFSFEGDGKVQALAFIPGGSLLATANEDGTIVLINAATATEHGRVTRPFACSRIAVSVDGSLLAAAWDDNTVSTFDITTSGSPAQLQNLACAAPIPVPMFDPTEPTIAVATADASTVVHDAGTMTEQMRIPQRTPVSHLTFSADGVLIATTDDDTVRVWRTT